MCRALRRLGVGEGDLEDVAQELFITVYDNLAAYDSTRPLRPWLLSFSLRFAANYRRLARHGGIREDMRALRRSSNEAPTEARDIVLRALETLDFERRAVLVMHDLEGWTAPEIAAEIDAPLNTVYSRLRLARAEFRSAVDRLQKEGRP